MAIVGSARPASWLPPGSKSVPGASRCASASSRACADGRADFSAAAPRLPNTSFFALAGIDGETLVGKLDRAGFAVASGSACSSANPEPSHTLMAMGVEAGLARAAIRVSLGAGSSEQDIDGFLKTLGENLASLRTLAAVAV
jgi:cysteine desulfurase